jgi:MoxR-like ATPase
MKFTAVHFDPSKEGETLDDGIIAYRRSVRRGGKEGKAKAGAVYLYPPRTILAVNVALATNRPLLIFGEPGSGKTTLARNVAAVLGRSYYQDTVTSRTQAKDLLYTFDTLGRLNDATNPKLELREDRAYIRPSTLWWAFNPTTAKRRGLKKWEDPAPPVDIVTDRGRDRRAVVLLDEVDKADPDVPNDLLEPFDQRTFQVNETGETIPAVREVLMILTTNGERELPPAFMRRCVTLKLDDPTADWYVGIAKQRYGGKEEPLFGAIAEEVMRLRAEAKKKNQRPPGTAEFLDAIEACRDLDVRTDQNAWTEVAASVLWKNERVDVPPKPLPEAQVAE